MSQAGTFAVEISSTDSGASPRRRRASDSALKGEYLRVKVVDNTKEDKPTINIRMPIGLVKFGLKMAQSFSPDVKRMNLDYDAIDKMVEEGVVGELVHIEDETEQKTIDVYVE